MLIFSVFPGVGKTTLAKRNSNLFINPTLNKKLGNRDIVVSDYISKVKKLIGQEHIILIPTTPDIITKCNEENLKITKFILPDKTILEEIIKHLKERLNNRKAEDLKYALYLKDNFEQEIENIINCIPDKNNIVWIKNKDYNLEKILLSIIEEQNN